METLYTKTGDNGQTSLIGGRRVSKGALRVACCGAVDEMGSALGLARSLSQREEIQTVLYRIQERLFSLGAELACGETGGKVLTHAIGEEDVLYLEQVVDHCAQAYSHQDTFVIPGKNPPSAALHLARTVVRRCERDLVCLSQETLVRPVVLQYINRLSDAVYALARLEEGLGDRAMPL